MGFGFRRRAERTEETLPGKTMSEKINDALTNEATTHRRKLHLDVIKHSIYSSISVASMTVPPLLFKLGYDTNSAYVAGGVALAFTAAYSIGKVTKSIDFDYHPIDYFQGKRLGSLPRYLFEVALHPAISTVSSVKRIRDAVWELKGGEGWKQELARRKAKIDEDRAAMEILTPDNRPCKNVHSLRDVFRRNYRGSVTSWALEQRE